VTHALDFIFFLALATLLAHELDAIEKREWRLFAFFRKMDDGTARRLFILLHIPVVAVLLWLVAAPNEGIRFWSMLALDLFMIVHAVLHRLLSGGKDYEFNTRDSELLIYGAGVLAAVHLALLWLLNATAPKAAAAGERLAAHSPFII